MKSLFACALAAFASTIALAQDFEGTIRWTFSFEITDPAIKQQMAAAQQQLADPELQVKMHEAQAAMASPEMQAMMAQNPQMKAMMEKQMAMLNPSAGSANNPFADLFPKGITVKTKGGNTLAVIEGGIAASETLTLSGTQTSYSINRRAQTYSTLSTGGHAEAEAGAQGYTVQKTDETAQILGYGCTKYLVATTGGKSGRYAVWATTDFKGFGSANFPKIRLGRNQSADFMQQIEGVPMKLEISSPEANITMVAASIKTETLPAGLFEIPAGFKQTTAGGL